MENEKYIHQWMNDELTSEELESKIGFKELEALKKLSHYTTHINVPKENSEEAFQNFQQLKKHKKGKVVNFSVVFKVAAAILLLIYPTYYFVTQNNSTTITTSIAETKILVLPDNSEVVLNGNSTISYAENNWNEHRNINLTGEAYFKVAKGKKFTVHTQSGTVQVLGTQFNVQDRTGFFQVDCYEGSVKVTYQNHEKILLPGKIIQILTENKIQHLTTPNKKPSWILKESSFNQTPLFKVIEELEKQYDINIVLKNVDNKTLFTGTFTHTNLEIALKTLTIPLKLTYTINQNEVIISK
ncbi:FecR family protein [Wenyingzhuangia sp. 2_MG-2023]|uniref:FecR family protein n=1 Tax=Wenyingzhuangia sp. 2_MG-2023 TaxID=3062639 RepID=UPI0026E3E48D|nr:FecR family protein [Wenyingzhuangia sp. 2_MG-2023]MDO6736687.1 FecR family protein [Wenyingzhuangia sp. 2_MG-2023]